MQHNAPDPDWRLHNGQWEPLPDEIRRQCRIIQDGWSANEVRKRRGLRLLDNNECDWSVPEVPASETAVG